MSGPATGPSPPRTEATRDVVHDPVASSSSSRRGSVSSSTRSSCPAIALAFVVLGFLDSFFRSWQDIILMFFLAWLLSFALLPLIELVDR